MYNKICTKESSSNGKIIRDSIHGDIFVPGKYLKIIDTPEFQRLRRIKQLSVANEVFPSADHSRFSHSLGTFYVMNLMINHFEKDFQKIGIEIPEKDKEVALLAALLHDVGHGPFSHAFENIHPEKNKNISHEEWTTKIITDEKSSINRVIIEYFGNDVPQNIADLIRKQRSIKKGETYKLESIDLFSVLSSLISSQLDADRLDYLYRDSFYAGVKFGSVDISRIISSLQVTVYNNRYYVCVLEKFLQDIEAYILARYQMQKVIYYHDFKILMEQLIKQIFNRAYELFHKERLEFCPSAMELLFRERTLSVSDYVRLDDSTFICAFQEWALSDDAVLSELCKAFLNREKYDKINALDNSNPILDKFKVDICEIFNNYSYHIDNLNNEYFWIERKKSFSAYKLKKDNIWIHKTNGLVVDLAQASNIIKDSPDKEIIWEDDGKVIYINYNILRKVPISNIENLIKDLKSLVLNYDIRKTIEIEKKYHFNEESIFDEVRDYIQNQKSYQTMAVTEQEQIDFYYDTSNGDLKKTNSTLRIRQKGDKYELTIKKSVIDYTDSNDQNHRFEFQKEIKENSLRDEQDFIFNHLDFLSKDSLLELNLIIRNKREPFKLKNNNIEFEMVFDRVTYESSNKKCKDFQIEIELKSDYQHRVNLKILTDDIEKNVSGLISSKTSKYLRGLELLNKM